MLKVSQKIKAASKKSQQIIKKVIKKISSIFVYVIFILSLILILLVNYVNDAFDNVTVEQLLFSMQTAEGTSDSMIIDGAKYIIPKVLIVLIIVIILKILLKLCLKNFIVLKTKIKTKTYTLSLVPLNAGFKLLLALLFLVFSVYYLIVAIGLDNYLSAEDSSFIKEHYVDPATTTITAPETKNNLIYIYIESLETSLFSSENGGDFKESIIPNLESLALDNLNFSNTELGGGAYMLNGTGWTIAGMVASSTGLPLKLPTWMTPNGYSWYGSFMPGAYSLGEVLAENGYKNYIMMGSTASFGGRKDFYQYHGDYQIMDLTYAKREGWIDDDYYVWWGYEDSKLYEFAKEQLIEIAANDEPFNFTMLTADSHATDGYLDSSCETPFDNQYLNVYNCADSMLNEFLSWLEEQDFYDDTTIVIMGDHLSMQGNLMSLFDADTFRERKIYNVYINAQKEASNTKNRLFSTFDYYPTTLSALGFDIEGDRLGLGTDLFSDKQTLMEQYGYEALNAELENSSQFYNDVILGGTFN